MSIIVENGLRINRFLRNGKWQQRYINDSYQFIRKPLDFGKPPKINVNDRVNLIDMEKLKIEQDLIKPKARPKVGPSVWKKAFKFGIIGLTIAAAGAAVYGLYKLCTSSDKVIADGSKHIDKPTLDKRFPTKTNPEKRIPPRINPDPYKRLNPSPTPKPTPNPVPDDSGKYIVKKGDTLWGIARNILIKQHKNDPNYKVSNGEILKKTEELMRLNNKKFIEPLPSDSTKRKVPLYAGEEIVV